MKAFTYDRFGEAGVLRLSEAPEPAIGPADVLVEIEACTINVIDIRVRSGMTGPLVSQIIPRISGVDVAGTVVAVGDSGKDLRVGDRVFRAADPFKGALAERIALPSTQVARLPPSHSISDAALCRSPGLRRCSP